MGQAPASVDDDSASSAQSSGHEPCNDESSEWSGRRKASDDGGFDATEPAPGDVSRDSGFVLSAGAVVGGRYRLERLIGEGGMGVVWEARHTVTRRPVALKFLKGCRDETSRRRLVREARAAGSVHHPGIVAVHDVIESDDGEPALVMDLLDGESLRARLARTSPLSLADTARLLVSISSALGAAHAAGIIHRDLKPENVFSLGDGSTRVLDFGVAKIVALDPQTAQSAGTQTGELVGTPMFMSPEQVFGERDVDHRSDFWSLGLIAYECLTGTLPTAADNIGQVLKTILTRRIEPLKVAAPHLPDEVCAMVDRMLSFERTARPWSAAEVAAVFAQINGVEPPAIEAPRAVAEAIPSHSAAKTNAPRRRSMAMIALGAMVVGAIAVTYSFVRETTPEPLPATKAATAIDPGASASGPSTLATATVAPRAAEVAVGQTATPPAGTVTSSAARVGARAPVAPSSVASSASVPGAPSAPAVAPTASPSDLQGAVVKTRPF